MRTASPAQPFVRPAARRLMKRPSGGRSTKNIGIQCDLSQDVQNVNFSGFSAGYGGGEFCSGRAKRSEPALRALVPSHFASKNLIEVPPPVQHADSFSHIVRDAVKDNVRVRSNRSQSWPHLVSGSPGEWVILEQPTRFVYFTRDLVGGMPAGNLRVIVPDFGEIGERFRRPVDWSPTAGHAVRSLA